MQAQWSPRKPIGRTPNVILAKSCAHQEAARRSIKNSTISDSIVRGRALTLRSERSGNPSTTILHTLTNPSSIAGEDTESGLDAADAATFTAPVGTTLAANTTYFVVVDFDQFRGFWGTTADGEESGAAGWSIADLGKFKLSSMTWTDDIGEESYYIRVNGTANAGTGSTGTPGSTDLVPQAWLARFGRTVAEQVVGAVESRLAPPRQRGVVASLAGQALPRWNADGRNAGGTAVAAARRKAKETRDSMAALSHWLSGSGKDGPDGRQSASGVRAVTERDLLTGTSFALTMETADGGTGALWGRGAISGFDGQEGALSLDGEVGTAMLGASSSGSALTLGLLMAHSRGNGGYRSADNGPGGKLRSTVTGLYPYVGYRLTPRLNVWGVAGTGAGSLTRKPKDGKALKTDIDLTMAAAGLRGVAVEAPEDGGIELAVKSDAMAVYTTSEAAGGGEGGELVAAEAEVYRLRLGLEATWRRLVAAGDGELTPRLEVGIRHDGGEAETGYGADIGGGLAWSDPERGIAADVSARGLVTHQAGGLRDTGISGSLSWRSDPSTGRGPSLTLSQALGGSSRGGVDSLLGRETLAGLAANDNGDELQRQRLELGLSYGSSAFGDRFTSSSELGLGQSDGHREYSLGWRLDRIRSGPAALRLRLKATRRVYAGDDRDAEHAIGFRLSTRW